MPSRMVHCHCPKCDGILVSDRTECKHQNQPDSVRLQRPAASGRKRQRAESSTPPGPHSSGPALAPDHERSSKVNKDDGDNIYEVDEPRPEYGDGDHAVGSDNEHTVRLICIKQHTITSKF
jgi:hypothetical protein